MMINNIIKVSKQLKENKHRPRLHDGLTLDTEQMTKFDDFFSQQLKKSEKIVQEQFKA